ncbi:hypothetical protein RDI58_007989 [Solanum bulbocastanum]|uniref:Uncharacterized protein n=1 Tax=Solanum bulbocastanum TaxID=147425 RepID=A0AAN8TZR2_SOLBU
MASRDTDPSRKKTEVRNCYERAVEKLADDDEAKQLLVVFAEFEDKFKKTDRARKYEKKVSVSLFVLHKVILKLEYFDEKIKEKTMINVSSLEVERGKKEEGKKDDAKKGGRDEKKKDGKDEDQAYPAPMFYHYQQPYQPTVAVPAYYNYPSIEEDPNSSVIFLMDLINTLLMFEFIF